MGKQPPRPQQEVFLGVILTDASLVPPVASGVTEMTARFNDVVSRSLLKTLC